MARFKEEDDDFNATKKSVDEINHHVGYIKSVVDIWIRFTPEDNIMSKIFSEVHNRLDRIRSLNDNLHHHNETIEDKQHHKERQES
jgi:hypothetical protein